MAFSRGKWGSIITCFLGMLFLDKPKGLDEVAVLSPCATPWQWAAAAGVILFFLLSKELPFSSPDRDSAATMRKTVKTLGLEKLDAIVFNGLGDKGGWRFLVCLKMGDVPKLWQFQWNYRNERHDQAMVVGLLYFQTDPFVHSQNSLWWRGPVMVYLL